MTVMGPVRELFQDRQKKMYVESSSLGCECWLALTPAQRQQPEDQEARGDSGGPRVIKVLTCTAWHGQTRGHHGDGNVTLTTGQAVSTVQIAQDILARQVIPSLD